MDAILLAGGKGSRMEDSLPKVLVKAKNKTILAHQLDYLLPKTNKIILAIGYKADQIIEYIKQNYKDQNIEFSIEETPLGTAGALKQAIQKTTSEKILVLNCDDLTNINIEKIKTSKENTICIAHPILPFGLIEEKEGYATFREKPILNSWVSCGWYLFHKKELPLPDIGSLEYDVFPKIKLRVHKHEGFWKPLNSKKDIEEFNKNYINPSN